MIQKKLVVMLTTAVLIGQTSLLATHLAQANSQLPLKMNTQTQSVRTAELLQVASVIQTRDAIDADTNPLLNRVTSPATPETPDLYTIGAEQGRLQTLIQVIPQNNDNASLFVNGTEILRFHGTVANKSAYKRVKTIADTLNESLTEDSKNSSRITLDDTEKNTLVIGETTLGEVDAQTAKTANEKPEKLAFLYTNRLRQALGQLPIAEPKLTPETNHAQTETALYESTGKRQVGVASWYGGMFHGRRTASGSRFNQYALTAAHRTLPFGTTVRVTNQRNKKSCIVKITDRGPYAHGRIIDLSKGAAQSIGMSGVSRVSLEVVKRNNQTAAGL